MEKGICMFLNHVCNRALTDLGEGNKEALSVIEDYFGKNLYDAIYEIVRNKRAAEKVYKETLREIERTASNYYQTLNAKIWMLTVARKQAFKYKEEKINSKKVKQAKIQQ